MDVTNRAARKIKRRVTEYLDQSSKRKHSVGWYTTKKYVTTNGFTNFHGEFVVVKVAKGNDFRRLAGKTHLFAEMVDQQIREAIAGVRGWFMSSANVAGKLIEHQKVTTWVHEIGHQIHFYAKTMPPPNGSEQNDMEWFAEHFAAWLLNVLSHAEYDKWLNSHIK